MVLFPGFEILPSTVFVPPWRDKVFGLNRFKTPLGVLI
jgi:hypothetical protein